MSRKVAEQVRSQMTAIAAELKMAPVPEKSDEWADEARVLGYRQPNEDVSRVTLTLETILPGCPPGLMLENEGYTSGLLAGCGLQELEVGDADFDDAFWIRADDPEETLAWLTPERRQLLLSLFLEKPLSIGQGRLCLEESLEKPDLESVRKGWETLNRTRDLLENPPAIALPVPRGVNRRQRARIYRPLFLVAAVCALLTVPLESPVWRAGFAGCSAYFTVTALAWWRGQKRGLEMLKTCRYLLSLLVACILSWLTYHEYTTGSPVKAGLQALVYLFMGYVGHFLLEIKLTEASRIRLS